MRGGQFHPLHGITQRKAYFPRIYKLLNVVKPEAIPVKLHTGATATVYRFHFETQLQNHLMSVAYSDLGNLDLPDPSDPFSSIPAAYAAGADPGHTSLIDSTWYSSVVKQKLSLLSPVNGRRPKYILHPLSLYIDKTGTDGIQKSTLEPLMCTSGILNQSNRQNVSNWFQIGVMPNLEQSSKAMRSSEALPNLQDYHRCMEVLLAPLKKFQQEMPTMSFRRGEEVAACKIICPVATILGDNVSSDKLCGRISSHGPTSVRMSRCCLTPYDQVVSVPHSCLPMPAHFCEKLSMAALGVRYGDPMYKAKRSKRKPANKKSKKRRRYPSPPPSSSSEDSDSPSTGDDGKGGLEIPISASLQPFRDWLQEQFDIHGDQRHNDLISLVKKREALATALLKLCLGSHPLSNAFRDVDFGPGYSVHSATTADIMHTVEEGVMTYLVKLLLDPMTKNQKKRLDKGVEDIFSNDGRNRSGEREQYPRVSFKKGFCSLKQISADEHVGQLFVIAILLRTEIGKKLLEPRFSLDFDRQREERVRRAAEAAKRKAEKAAGVYGPSKKHRPAVRGEVADVAADDPPEAEEEEEDDVGEENAPEENEEDDNSATRTDESSIDCDSTSSNEFSEFDSVLKKLDLKFVLDSVGLLPEAGRQVAKERMEAILKFSQSTKKLLGSPGPLFGNCCLDYQDAVSEPEPTVWPDIAELFVSGDSSDQGPVHIERRRETFSIKLNMDQFADYCELLLSFHAFLKYGSSSFKEQAEQEAYQKSYCQLMTTLVQGFDRGPKTNGWNLQKVVECHHFGRDHVVYGPPVGHNTATGESGLKLWAKAPAITAQNRSPEVFTGQVVKNLQETELLDRIVASVQHSNSPKVDDAVDEENSGEIYTTGGGRTLVFKKKGSVWGVYWSKPNRNNRSLKFPKQISDWFVSTFVIKGRAPSGLTIQLVTELTIGEAKGNKELLRAHPNYRNEGPWYDFVDIHYGKEAGNYPARCACFFEWPDGVHPDDVGLKDLVEDPEEDLDQELDKSQVRERVMEHMAGQLLVLIHESKERSRAELDQESMLFSHYTLGSRRDRNGKQTITVPILRCIYPHAIQGRVYVVDPLPGNGGIFWKVGDIERNKPPPPFSIIKVKDRQSVWPIAFTGIEGCGVPPPREE